MKKKITIWGVILTILGGVYTTIIEPSIKTFVTERVKVEVSKDKTSSNDGDVTVVNPESVVKDASLDTSDDSTNQNNQDEYIDVYSEEFNLANKYIIQAGQFTRENGAYERLNEVRTVYPDAYVESIERQRDNEKKIYYRVILDKGESLSVSQIYNKSIECHNNLLNVINDEISVGEKVAAPLIENKYLQEKLEAIEKYAHQKDFENAKKCINSVLNVVNTYTRNGYNGYIEYKNEIKKILERDENNVLKLGLSEVYNNL